MNLGTLRRKVPLLRRWIAGWVHPVVLGSIFWIVAGMPDRAVTVHYAESFVLGFLGGLAFRSASSERWDWAGILAGGLVLFAVLDFSMGLISFDNSLYQSADIQMLIRLMLVVMGNWSFRILLGFTARSKGC